VAHLTISFMKNGQVTVSHKVGRSGESVSDLVEAFAHFTEKVFPPKMLLFSTVLSAEELNEAQQQLIANNWVDAYPFLHAPVIDVMEPDDLFEIIINTGGKAVAESKGLMASDSHAPSSLPMPGVVEGEEVSQKENDDFFTNDFSSNHSVAMSDNLADVKAEEGEILSFEEEKNTSHPIDAADLGFATTIKDVPKPIPAGKPVVFDEPKMAHEKDSKEEFAFELKKDHPSHPHHHGHLANTANEPEVDHSVHHESAPHHTHPKQTPKQFIRAHIPFIATGIIGGLLVLMGITFLAASKTTQAFVKVTLRTLPISKEVALTLDSKVAQSNPDKLILKATTLSQSEQGEKTIDTTGSKIIGDKAKGTVTFYNYTTSEKTFGSGTKLSNGKLSFTLDNSVTVASASTSLDSSNNKLTKPGTADADATAAQIGEDSNIGQGTDLTIESFSKDTYLATTKTPFTGGTSREVRAVSQQDKDKVLSDLKAELIDKATQDFKTTSPSGVYTIPTNKVKVENAQYSAELGKETNTLTLSLTLTVDGLSYKSEDLKPLALQVLSQEVPAGYTLDQEVPQILSSPASNSSTSAQVALQANISSVAIPQVDPNTWKQEIAGKPEKEAQQTLAAKKEVESATIAIEPKFFAILFHSLPKNAEHITFEVSQ
jgi:hypothetical protein